MKLEDKHSNKMSTVKKKIQSCLDICFYILKFPLIVPVTTCKHLLRMLSKEIFLLTTKKQNEHTLNFAQFMSKQGGKPNLNKHESFCNLSNASLNTISPFYIFQMFIFCARSLFFILKIKKIFFLYAIIFSQLLNQVISFA